MYPLHKNDTGSFQELAHASDIQFGQLSLLTIAPRRSRGGHYHTHKKEWFCCLHGSCYLVLTNPEGKQLGSGIALNEDNREFVAVLPHEVHTILNPHDRECELLVICNEEYDPDNPDTIKFEVKGEPVCSR